MIVVRVLLLLLLGWLWLFLLLLRLLTHDQEEKMLDFARYRCASFSLYGRCVDWWRKPTTHHTLGFNHRHRNPARKNLACLTFVGS